MSSPRALAGASPSGLPGSSTDLSPRAVPFHPGKSSGCFCSLLHRWCQASSNLEDWPLSLRANGAVSGSLALRLAGSPPRASPAELLPPTPPVGYLLNEQLQGKLLSAYKISQAYPGAPGPRYPCSKARLPGRTGRFSIGCSGVTGVSDRAAPLLRAQEGVAFTTGPVLDKAEPRRSTARRWTARGVKTAVLLATAPSTCRPGQLYPTSSA